MRNESGTCLWERVVQVILWILCKCPQVGLYLVSWTVQLPGIYSSYNMQSSILIILHRNTHLVLTAAL